jgi:DNA polymerase-3 subunit gamma/tau
VAEDFPERARLLQLADRMKPEFVQLAYQIAVHGRKELSLAPDEQSGFVMTLLRLHSFRPVPIDASTTSLFAANDGTQTAITATSAPAQLIVPAERQNISFAKVQATRYDADSFLSASTPHSTQMDMSADTATCVAAIGSVRPAQCLGEWRNTLLALKLGGMARELAQHCELRDLDGDLISLRLAPAHRHLQIKPAQDKLQQALSEYLGKAIQLRIELADVEGVTPAAAAQHDRRERQDRAVSAIEKDGFVREIIEMFDATLIESSIKSV